MPLGIERINARRLQPNDHIVFIKPLEGPDKALAQDFLERVAAICRPIMKANHLAIMSLEEYEPNLEFVGRNFNAGEVIQLVLKAPYTGNWLPFRHVQMVMMHELAHCKQMNHSGAFWKVRSQYAVELRGLWEKGYTGEGLWGRGKTLLSGQYANSSMPDAEMMPKQLCGGTYRSSQRGVNRKRKRKAQPAKPTLTYAERQQRRIAKKFGTDGATLGDDTDTKVKLEDGKKVKGKPRVAQSARGRELRAAAALQRFNQPKVETEAEIKEEDVADETESEFEDGDIKTEAIDLDGTRMLDSEGHGMVKVCEGGEEGGDDSKREMFELQQVDETPSDRATVIKQESDSTAIEDEGLYHTLDEPDTSSTTRNPPKAKLKAEQRNDRTAAGPSPIITKSTTDSTTLNKVSVRQCPVCSLENEPLSVICVACSNVLDLRRVPDNWRCHNVVCGASQYINAGDCGVCGICGVKKGLYGSADAG